MDFGKVDRIAARRTRIVLGWAAALVCLLGVVVWQYRAMVGPFYEGRSVGDWFDEYSLLSGGKEFSSGAAMAFRSMGGDAVPFLVGVLEGRPAPYERLYAQAVRCLPTALVSRFPRPRVWAADRQRAMRLLQIVARQELELIDRGEGVGKSSVTHALAPLAAALRSSEADLAASTLACFGPLAAPLVPDLIAKVRDGGGPRASFVLQALGEIGPAASDAVPVITRIAAEEPGDIRVFAVQALGHIGAAAQSAVPVLTRLLTAEDPSMPAAPGEPRGVRMAAATSLARIGSTPEESVAAFMAMTHSTNEWTRQVAAIALWNRDRLNPDLRAGVVEGLWSGNAFPVCLVLMSLGTNAAVFEPEVRSLLADPELGAIAKRTLRQIHPASQ